VELQPGKPAIVRAEATGDAPGRAAEHRTTLRAIVAEHGVVLVRGLGLRDAAGTTAVFRRPATTLMAEKEAFARPQVYAARVYSSASWPANQQMCMHHELSHRLEVPSLMLFACLGAPTRGGATAVRDSPSVLTPASRSASEHSASAEIVELINAVYEDNTVREPWQAGDLMLVDNVRIAHSREAYEGPREVLVGMADPVRLADCSPPVW
jgi:alpha-ketoglutarate-dependent taurine dioxygenase